MSDNIKHKLSDYEVLPPEEVWKNIAVELDETRSYQPVAEKMYGYEVMPPAEVWSNIALVLKKDAPPVRNMRSLFRKLAVAAVVVGLIMVSSVYLFHKESTRQDDILVKKGETLNDEQQKAPPAAETPVEQPPIATGLPTLTLRKTDPLSTHSVAKASYRQRRRPLAAAIITPGYVDMNQEMNDIIVKGRLIRNERGDIIQDAHILTGGDDDEYISVTGPNGQQTRISSKFADVMLYLNGNENMNDAEWQRKFQDWRTRIMQTSFIPSSNNFLDILELKDFILKDNQQ